MFVRLPRAPATLALIISSLVAGCASAAHATPAAGAASGDLPGRQG
jgi:hypothetical protein